MAKATHTLTGSMLGFRRLVREVPAKSFRVLGEQATAASYEICTYRFPRVLVRFDASEMSGRVLVNTEFNALPVGCLGALFWMVVIFGTGIVPGLLAYYVLKQRPAEQQEAEVRQYLDAVLGTTALSEEHGSQSEYRWKRVSVTAFTNVGRQKELVRQRETLAKKGWEFMSLDGETAYFRRPA